MTKDCCLEGGGEKGALAHPNQDGLCLYRETNVARWDEHQVYLKQGWQADKSPLLLQSAAHGRDEPSNHASLPGRTLRPAEIIPAVHVSVSVGVGV